MGQAVCHTFCVGACILTRLPTVLVRVREDHIKEPKPSELLLPHLRRCPEPGSLPPGRGLLEPGRGFLQPWLVASSTGSQDWVPGGVSWVCRLGTWPVSLDPVSGLGGQ